MKLQSTNKEELDSVLARRLKRKKELNDMVYVKSSSSKAEKVANSITANQEGITDENNLPLLFQRLNPPNEFLDKTRDEVTAAAAALQDMLWHQYATTATENNKHEQQDDDAVRDEAEEIHRDIAGQRDAPNGPKSMRTTATPCNIYASPIASCAPISRPTPETDAQGMFQSTCSDFSEFDAPTFTCADYPSSLVSEVKGIKPKALVSSMETAILTKIDATERSIFGVIAPKDTARLDAMERQLATLNEAASEEEGDGLHFTDTFTLAESPSGTFDSIEAASSEGDESTIHRTRSTVTEYVDGIEMKAEDSIIPTSKKYIDNEGKTAKPRIDEKEVEMNKDRQGQLSMMSKLKCKLGTSSTKKSERSSAVYDITRMASF